MTSRLLSGVLLAGGGSRRMGRDKAWLAVDGVPLARRVLTVLSAVCDDIVVASGDGHRLAALGYPQVADPHPSAGPLGGLVAGLAAARHELVAVLAVDLPEANAAVLARLAAIWTGEPAVVPRTHGRLQPLHALWTRSAEPRLRAQLATGEQSVSGAVEALGARIVGEETWGDLDAAGAFARNVNRPEDLPGAGDPG